ncbi:hypothetical protein B6U99_05340 [Candidatus Geothermarchaeota archaeon ex4572_27]|nr:MAG: hypothetical protein B6U99_05340 [Candidatus Geothermarchaeota archaeon ex4572_27]
MILCPICGRPCRSYPGLAQHLKVHGYKPRTASTRNARKSIPKTALYDIARFLEDYENGDLSHWR